MTKKVHPQQIAELLTAELVLEYSKKKGVRPKELLSWTPGELLFMWSHARDQNEQNVSQTQQLLDYYQVWCPDRKPKAPYWLMPEVPRWTDNK